MTLYKSARSSNVWLHLCVTLFPKFVLSVSIMISVRANVNLSIRAQAHGYYDHFEGKEVEEEEKAKGSIEDGRHVSSRGRSSCLRHVNSFSSIFEGPIAHEIYLFSRKLGINLYLLSLHVAYICWYSYRKSHSKYLFIRNV
jgi:hypothetical protein